MSSLRVRRLPTPWSQLGDKQVAHDFRVLREAARVDPEWAVIDQIWTALATPYAPDARLMDLTPGQRAIYALTWIRSEVRNGGFDQCFSNSTGFLLPEAVEGARLLDTPAWVDLLGRAMSLFPSPYPRDRLRRQELLDELAEEQSSTMNGLDDELYDLDAAPATSLDALFRRYIEQHDDEFFRPNGDEEAASAALLGCARGLVNTAPPRRLDLAEELLSEAIARSRSGGTGKTAAVAESLLRQLPDMAG